MSQPRSPWFSPAVLGAHLLTLVLVSIAAGLGFWQLSAWRADREQSSTDRTALAPIPIAEAMGPDDPFPGDAVGRPVTLDGTWVPGSTVFVADRTHGDERGWWVATAVTPENEHDASLYVVREFVTDLADAAPEPTGVMSDVVWLQAAEASGGVLDPDPDDDVILNMRTADLMHHVSGDLYSGFGFADEDLVPAISEASVWTGLRNFFYAFEWWVFGGFALFMWTRFLMEVRQGHEAELAAAYERAPEPEEAAAPPPPETIQQVVGPNRSGGRFNDVNSVLNRYRVMASIVGVLLIVLILIGVPLANFTGEPMWGIFDSTPYLVNEGSTANDWGRSITHYLGVAHGWLYMIFLFAAFHLALRARWRIGFSIVTLLCGTIPVLSFWAERRAVRAVRREFPEEFDGSATADTTETVTTT